MHVQTTPLSDAFRPCVGLVVIDSRGLYWTGERMGYKGSWQWPQGGIDHGETAEEAAWRELHEETGLTGDHVELVAECPEWFTYEVPRTRPTYFGWRGQTQKWFLFRYKGDPALARGLAEASEDFCKEFSDFKWQGWETFYPAVVDFKQPLYLRIKEWLGRIGELPGPETASSFDGFVWRGSAPEVELVRTSRQYAAWIRRLDQSFTISEIRVQAVDRRRDGGLLFAKLLVKAVDRSGQPVPGAVLMRGDASAVLLVLDCEGERYTALVRQARFAAGLASTREIPAGMLDDSMDPAAVAVREVMEETGLQIAREDLVDLGGFYPSCALCDEIVYLFAARKRVTREELTALEGRLCGCQSENEHIRVEILPLRELPISTGDPKSLFAYWRYMQKELQKS